MFAPGACSSKRSSSRPTTSSDRHAHEDDEVQGARGELSAHLAENPRTAESSHDPQGTHDPEDAEDAQRRNAAEEVEEPPLVEEVPGLRRCRLQPIDEVDDEDDREGSLDEQDEVPRLRLERVDEQQRQVDDREDRHREHEELVHGALEVAAIGRGGGLAHVRELRACGRDACYAGRARATISSTTADFASA